MAQATHKQDTLLWLQGMPVSLDRLPADQVKYFLLSRLREIDLEIDQIARVAPSVDWWLQRVGEPFVDLNAPVWDPLLYLEYLKTTRRAIVASLQML
jgi:hypothetical protein